MSGRTSADFKAGFAFGALLTIAAVYLIIVLTH